LENGGVPDFLCTKGERKAWHSVLGTL
jgi:hypothetical protein